MKRIIFAALLSSTALVSGELSASARTEFQIRENELKEFVPGRVMEGQSFIDITRAFNCEHAAAFTVDDIRNIWNAVAFITGMETPESALDGMEMTVRAHSPNHFGEGAAAPVDSDSRPGTPVGFEFSEEAINLIDELIADHYQKNYDPIISLRYLQYELASKGLMTQIEVEEHINLEFVKAKFAGIEQILFTPYDEADEY